MYIHIYLKIPTDFIVFIRNRTHIYMCIHIDMQTCKKLAS